MQEDPTTGGERLDTFESEWAGSFPSRDGEEFAGYLRDVEFPVALRGYSKEAVDAYVAHVNRVIVELRMNRSPRSAVRHALDQVSEQVAGLLREAREAADEIVAGARGEADQLLAAARDEAFTTGVKARADADGVAEGAEQLAEERRRRCDAEIAAMRAEAEQELVRLAAQADDLRAERERAAESLRALAAKIGWAADSGPIAIPVAEPDAEEGAVDDPPPADEPEGLTDVLHRERARRARQVARARLRG